MQKIDLSRREIAAWAGVIAALVLLGLVAAVARKMATREEVRAPEDPYRAARARVDPVKAHTTRAYCHEAKGSTGMAIGEYRELVKLNPDDITAHGSLSALHFKVNDRDKAIAEILEVLRIDPSKWAQREILADTYCEMGDYDRAGQEYEEALRYNPRNAMGRCKLGRVYYLKGKYALSLDEFRKAIEIYQKIAEAHLGLGLSHLAMGDRRSAETELGILEGLDSGMARSLASALGGSGTPTPVATPR